MYLFWHYLSYDSYTDSAATQLDTFVLRCLSFSVGKRQGL